VDAMQELPLHGKIAVHPLLQKHAPLEPRSDQLSQTAGRLVEHLQRRTPWDS